ncbi:MAG: hypothetical protein P8Q97_09215 [Myxococcota bacterium]|nr:hypothetical protein [Myxococcota bacterium]
MSSPRTAKSRSGQALAGVEPDLRLTGVLWLALVGLCLLLASPAVAAPRVFLCRTVDASCSCVPDEAEDSFVVHGNLSTAAPLLVDLCLRVGATTSTGTVSSCDPLGINLDGDEICAMHVVLAPYGGMSVQSFSPTSAASPSGLGGSITTAGELIVNWVDTRSPLSAGAKVHLGTFEVVWMGTTGEGLRVSSASEVVDVDFSPAVISIDTGTLVVPEPSLAWSLFVGLIFLIWVSGRRQALGMGAFLGVALAADPSTAGLLLDNTSMLSLEALGHGESEAGDRQVVAIGDVNGDGVKDLAIGLPTASLGMGAVVIVMMRADGTVQRTFRLASGTAGDNGTLSLPLTDNSGFGDAIASLGDLGGGTFTDRTVLAVAAPGDARVWLIVLRPRLDGAGVTVEDEIVVPFAVGPVVRSLANIGDVDGNGVPDLALGQPDATSTNCPLPTSACGVVGVAFMGSGGSLVGEGLLESGVGGMPFLVSMEKFGTALAPAGGVPGDGIFAVGAPGHRGGEGGFLLVQLLTGGSSVSSATRFDQVSLSLSSWGVGAGLGATIAQMVDPVGGRTLGLAVGAPKALGLVGTPDAGAIAVLQVDPLAGFSLVQAIDQASGEVPQAYGIGISTMLGQSIAFLDVSGDGLPEVFVDAAKDAVGTISGIYESQILDGDEDGVPDVVDNCPALRNTDQQDSDNDGVGDLCDNCRDILNPDQGDDDFDQVGDACEPVRVSLTAVGTASSPAWTLELDCGASDVTHLELALVPHRSANTLGWIRSLEFGGGCGPPAPTQPGGGTVGCTASLNLGATVDPVESGAFVTDSNGVMLGYPPLRSDTLYVLLSGNAGLSGQELCSSQDPLPVFLGDVTSSQASPGETTSLFVSLDLGLGGSAILGSGALASPGTQEIPIFEAITVVSSGANRSSGLGTVGGGP